MTGYRQSSFDPNSYEQPGKPLRPYNWVQWTGVALAAAGALLYLAEIAARIGWIAGWSGDLSPAPIFLTLIGVFLIYSRREPGTTVGSEQLAKSRRTLIIAVAIGAAIIGAALVIELPLG